MREFAEPITAEETEAIILEHRIVYVAAESKGETTAGHPAYFCIQCTVCEYYRTKAGLDSEYAWDKHRSLAARFKTRPIAQAVLEAYSVGEDTAYLHCTDHSINPRSAYEPMAAKGRPKKPVNESEGET